tara:strand:+ start:298 stop:774 length:477 start_codon:yes stop_codon:yes gene_type:complete
MIKSLTITLLSLIITGSVWATDDFETINQSLDKLESEPDYEGKRLDIQYFLTKKCAGVYEILIEIGEEDIEEIASRFISASIGLRLMIGGNKPGGLDKSRDEIALEVNEDVKNYKDAYLSHLVNWYESPERNPEAIISKSFAEDLRICISIADSMNKE